MSEELSDQEADYGEYDEPNLTADELLDLALDNAQISADGNDWAHSYLRDVTALRAEVEAAREVAARLEQDQAEALRIVEAGLASAHFANLYVALFDARRILSPSSLADFEALGSPVGDEGGNDE